MKRQIIIIGGGASGLAAGIEAARTGAKTIIIEHMDRAGKKILATGNGKCNLTNIKLDQTCYYSDNPGFPMKVIEQFPVERTLAFFRELGILPKMKQGYVYPNSEQASSVLDVLRMEAQRLLVTLICSCEIISAVKTPDSRFQLKTNKGNYEADALILATGSKAAETSGSDGSGYKLAESFGHGVIKPLPALVQLCCRGSEYKQLSGIRTEARLTLLIDGKEADVQTGELQLTDYGISGIPTFQLSRHVSKALDKHKKAVVSIDFLPGMTDKETREFLETRQRSRGDKTGEEFLVGAVNKKLALVLLKLSGIPVSEKVSLISAKSLNRLIENLKAFRSVIEETKPFAYAQVCCGGVDTKEVNPATMQSKLVPGLYLAGELLDVDGICGGYNLQWAWSSGCLAGYHAGRGVI